MGFDNVCGEIVKGGILGLCGIDQIDWGGQAGACYEVWKCSPCCGSPDPLGCILCLVHWTCCGCCSGAKLYASSLSEHVACVPHCCCYWICYPCARLFTRYNLRKKAGVSGNMLGDCCCIWFCAPFACCQELRSVSVEAWRLFPDCTIPEIYHPGCKFIK